MPRKPPSEPRVKIVKSETNYLGGLVAMAVTALVASAPTWWLKAQLAETEAKIEAVKTAQLVSRQEIENNLLRAQTTAGDNTNTRLEALRKDIEAGFGKVNSTLEDLKTRVRVVEVTAPLKPGR